MSQSNEGDHRDPTTTCACGCSPVVQRYTFQPVELDRPDGLFLQITGPRNVAVGVICAMVVEIPEHLRTSGGPLTRIGETRLALYCRGELTVVASIIYDEDDQAELVYHTEESGVR